MYDYDVAVLGAGSGGLVACKVAKGLGKRTALIEKRKLGGDCTWFGCVPSKTLIKSANIAHQTTRLREFGLEPGGPVELNADKVMSHVRAVVQADADGHPPETLEAEGINVLFGAGRFLDSHNLMVGDKKISANKFIVCTGSHPFIPPIQGLEDIPCLTNETIFDLDALPASMIVLGAGPIGIELSAALNRLGVKVTILQRSDKILKKDDPELVERLVKILRYEGVEILTETKTTGFSRQDDKVIAEVEDEKGRRQIVAESALISVGRRPNLNGLDLEKAGVEFDETGVRVDRHLRTTAKNIYACGDVVPPYLFTHIAEYEAIIAATNACFALPIRKTNYDNVLWATYTDPELAHAGLTEEQARQRYGDAVRIYRWEHKDVDRAKTDLASDGLSKFVCDNKGKLLGIHILGHGAAELMHEAQLVKSLGLPFSKIASVIHAYPSYSDAVRQPAKRCYIDVLQNNPFIKLLKKLKPGKDER
ncbi:MAG: FAD-dependent oxidoreductase [Phycisphaerales bacterium]|nr:MAG: FAD-dependent oxidoreductase [Phycisphaerales bacterium]